MVNYRGYYTGHSSIPTRLPKHKFTMIPSDPRTFLMKAFTIVVLLWFLSLWVPAFMDALSAVPV